MAIMSKILAGALALAAASAPAVADTLHRSHVVRHRAHGRTLVVRPRTVVVAPAKYAPLGPDEFVDPANPGYVYGVDDGSRYDTAADGIGVARESGDLVPRDGSTKAYARSGGPGLEFEGPPIYRSLPVVPELISPELY